MERLEPLWTWPNMKIGRHACCSLQFNQSVKEKKSYFLLSITLFLAVAYISPLVAMATAEREYIRVSPLGQRCVLRSWSSPQMFQVQTLRRLTETFPLKIQSQQSQQDYIIWGQQGIIRRHCQASLCGAATPPRSCGAWRSWPTFFMGSSSSKGVELCGHVILQSCCRASGTWTAEGGRRLHCSWSIQRWRVGERKPPCHPPPPQKT